MPVAMTLRLSDEDNEALRAQAEQEGRSMQLVVSDAVKEYITRRATAGQVEEALHVLRPRFAGLLDRLGKA